MFIADLQNAKGELMGTKKSSIAAAILCALLIVSSASASEFTDLLDKAKGEYEAGNLSAAIELIDSAKKLADKENLNGTADEYIEVTDWNVVKLKKLSYIGKKVKVRCEFSGISSDGEKIYVEPPKDYSITCTFDKTLIDKILTLKKSSYSNPIHYTFYGTITATYYSYNNTYGSAGLHITAID